MSDTVIIGAGIIGCSTAFFLSESPRTRPRSVHLIEASPELFHCASGLAGGFLAADWFAPSVAPLGRLSFDLHKQLAGKYNGHEKWGYSRVTACSLSQDDDIAGARDDDWLRERTSRAQAAGGSSSGDGEGPAWLTRTNGTSVETISGGESTAVVNPLHLCQFLLDECLARGVQLHHPARCISVSKDAKSKLSSVKVHAVDGTETDISCTCLIITSGPWTPQVFSELFPSAETEIPVTSLAGHSLLIKSPRWTSENGKSGCYSVFATDTLGFSPEVFSRRDGEIFLAGLNSTSLPLPNSAADVRADKKAIQQLKDVARQLLCVRGHADDIEFTRESLCFRPVTPSGRPIVSRIRDEDLGGGFATAGGGNGGVFVGAGHGPWGISHSLGTGLVLSELVEGRSPSVNIKALGLH